MCSICVRAFFTHLNPHCHWHWVCQFLPHHIPVIIVKFGAINIFRLRVIFNVWKYGKLHAGCTQAHSETPLYDRTTDYCKNVKCICVRSNSGWCFDDVHHHIWWAGSDVIHIALHGLLIKIGCHESDLKRKENKLCARQYERAREHFRGRKKNYVEKRIHFCLSGIIYAKIMQSIFLRNLFRRNSNNDITHVHIMANEIVPLIKYTRWEAKLKEWKTSHAITWFKLRMAGNPNRQIKNRQAFRFEGPFH